MGSASRSCSTEATARACVPSKLVAFTVRAGAAQQVLSRTVVGLIDMPILVLFWSVINRDIYTCSPLAAF